MKKHQDSTSPRGPRNWNMLWLQIVSALSNITTLAYLTMRFLCMTRSKETSPAIVALLWIEMAVQIPRLVTRLAVGSMAGGAKGERTSVALTETYVLPRVDIFVTYCGEGVDIAMDTVRAALAQDYPPQLIRVVVLDDSASSSLSTCISRMADDDHRNVFYACRGVKVTTHSKAANLNFGLGYSDRLEHHGAEFVMVLDVDMIPEPGLLRSTLSYILRDPQIGLAGCSQWYYNIPPNDPLSMLHETRLVRNLVILQDTVDRALCLGSGFLVKRAALEDVGGFPEQSMQEDILTSVVLSSKGWQTVYVPGALQWGLAADSYSGWIRQRQRWAAGIVSVSQYLCTSSTGDMNPQARINIALWGIMDVANALILTASMFLLPIFVASGRPLMHSDHLKALCWLATLDFVLQGCFQAILNSIVGFQNSLLNYLLATWTAPYRFIVTVSFFILPKIQGRPLPKFTPTGIETALGEAERQARAAGGSCLRTVLFDCGAWTYLVMFLVCLTGPTMTVRQLDFRTVEYHDVCQILFTRMFWPPAFTLWMTFLKHSWKPVAYGLMPPPNVPRHDLLQRDEKTGVAYPKKRVKEEQLRKDPQGFWLTLAAYYLIALSATITFL